MTRLAICKSLNAWFAIFALFLLFFQHFVTQSTDSLRESIGFGGKMFTVSAHNVVVKLQLGGEKKRRLTEFALERGQGFAVFWKVDRHVDVFGHFMNSPHMILRL